MVDQQALTAELGDGNFRQLSLRGNTLPCLSTPLSKKNEEGRGGARHARASIAQWRRRLWRRVTAS